MNDLDQVRTMRATVPAPAEDRLAAGRGRLLAAVSRPRRSPRLTRPGWRLAVPAVAAAAAGAVAAVAILGGTATPSHSGAVPAGQVSLATRILTTAARTVAAEPAARPGDRQWVYSMFVQTETGQPAQSDESWTRFDGRENALIENGRLVTTHDPSSTGSPEDFYGQLAALPASPRAILAAARSVVGTTPRQWELWAAGSIVAGRAPETTGQAEFDYLASLLWQSFAAAPPAAQAHVYQAMAAIPGVTVTRGMRNAAGRAGIGVTAGQGSWMLLDPRTFQVIGVNERGFGKSSKAKNAPVVFSETKLAFTAVAIVDAAGQR